ncbi:MAG: ATP-binding cassette domain-containing protein [Nocardioides sp.]
MSRSLVGSSRSRTLGSLSNSRRSWKRRRSPPERSPIREVSQSPVKPNRSSIELAVISPSVVRVTRTVDGEVTASAMLERFGFTGDRLTARLCDLSGGERRRFQLLLLLLTEPNVLLLDEPTNDLDIETLNVLEDFLDGWPGTLVVVSHDRYFLERVTDSVWALLDDGQISMLPGGVDDYLSHRRSSPLPPPKLGFPAVEVGVSPTVETPEITPGPVVRRGSAAEREARKALERLDRHLDRIRSREAELHALVEEHAQDYERLSTYGAELGALVAEREELETHWLEIAGSLE